MYLSERDLGGRLYRRAVFKFHQRCISGMTKATGEEDRWEGLLVGVVCHHCVVKGLA